MFFQRAQAYSSSLLIMVVASFQIAHCPQLVVTLVHELEQHSQIVGQWTFWSSQTDKDEFDSVVSTAVRRVILLAITR